MRQRVESRDKSYRRGSDNKHRDDYGRDDQDRFRHNSGHTGYRRDHHKTYNTAGYYPAENDVVERPRRPESRDGRGPEFPEARFSSEPLPKLQKLSTEGANEASNTETGTSGLDSFLSSK